MGGRIDPARRSEPGARMPRCLHKPARPTARAGCDPREHRACRAHGASAVRPSGPAVRTGSRPGAARRHRARRSTPLATRAPGPLRMPRRPPPPRPGRGRWHAHGPLPLLDIACPGSAKPGPEHARRARGSAPQAGSAVTHIRSPWTTGIRAEPRIRDTPAARRAPDPAAGRAPGQACRWKTSVAPSRSTSSVSKASRWLPISMPGEPIGMPGTESPRASGRSARRRCTSVAGTWPSMK